MTQLSLQIPQINQPDSTEDAKIASNFTAIQNVVNGNLDATNLATGVLDGRGFANIPTSESRTNTAYGTLTTPDQVTGVVLPSNGLIAVWYQATWQESVQSAASAALFIGTNQLQIAAASFGATATHASIAAGVTAGTSVPLASASTGLFSTNGALTGVSTPYSGDVTTGQLVGGGVGGDVAATPGGTPAAMIQMGGPCWVFAAAGTYTVSVKFKSSSGSVTASNRQLWVRALAFS